MWKQILPNPVKEVEFDHPATGILMSFKATPVAFRDALMEMTVNENLQTTHLDSIQKYGFPDLVQLGLLMNQQLFQSCLRGPPRSQYQLTS